MDANQALAERFEEHRLRLRAVAYRMLGSLSEADDAVQQGVAAAERRCRQGRRAPRRVAEDRRGPGCG
jgi:DNA-directed RNA polymerase specialized sigma24 family protein